jgi:hypothetical protein
MVNHNSMSEKGDEFRLIFTLMFEGHNWFCLLKSDWRISLPGQDVEYPFLKPTTLCMGALFECPESEGRSAL